MKIEIVIPDSKVKEVKEYFLHVHPIPKDEEGKPLFTFPQWIKKWLRKQLVHAYRGGKRRKKWDEFSVAYEMEE